MTTMDYTKTMRALRWLKVETGSLACLGCGYEHNCSTHGCAIIRNAVEHMEAALSNYDTLSSLVDQKDEEIKEHVDTLAYSEAARSDLARQLAAARKKLAEIKAELDAAVRGQETLQKALMEVKAERDAAVSDLNEIMYKSGCNIDTCEYCKSGTCYGRNGTGVCEPKWRGPQKDA